MNDPALLFGPAADAYERHRLGYPDAVADLTLAYADPPVATALEVGAGTGKATRLFAGRGVAVTALEPDPAMAAVLRRATAGLHVDVLVTRFEGLEPSPDLLVDLLLCAQAWHWTDPATRYDLTAALLRPGGTVAIFGIVDAGSALVDPALDEQVRSLEHAVLAEVPLATAARSAKGIWWPGSDLEADGRFTDVEQHDLPRVVRRTRDEHVGLLATLSPYLRLTGAERASLLAAITAALPDEVEVDATTRLHLARRI